MFLEEWKLARVSPIYTKQGNEVIQIIIDLFQVLSTIARSFEKVIYEQLCDYLSRKKF